MPRSTKKSRETPPEPEGIPAEIRARMRQKLEILPSDLVGLAYGPEKFPGARVAVDTETSGLRVDEGARISTVSVGWIDWDGSWERVVTSHQWASGIQTYRTEEINPGEFAPVVSFAWPFDQGVTGTGKAEDTGQEALWPDAENLPPSEFEALLRWLELVGQKVGLSMQNEKFDCHMFEAGVRRWPGFGQNFVDLVQWDTQNGNDLLFGWLPSTSLKGKGSASEHLWGEAESDEKNVISNYLKKHKLPKGRWDLMPWEVIAKYADQDARLTCRLDHVHQTLLKKYPSEKWFEGWLDGKDGRLTLIEAAQRRMQLTRMLYRMERRGLPYDVEASRSWGAVIRTRAAKEARKLPFAPPTLDMAKHYWFGDGKKRGVEGLGNPAISTTPSGAVSLTADDVGKLVAGGFPGAEHWRDFAKLQRADSMWYTGYAEKAGEDDRLRTSVRQNGTRSGRFSVEGVQLQAIPHDYKLSNFSILEGIPTPRQLIGSAVPEGYQLWELDLANAEARVAALYADCKLMLEMIMRGDDLHGETAKQLFKVEKSSPQWGEKRSVAKRANFSLIFGVGWQKLQLDIEQQTGVRMTDHETQVLVTKWRKLYPEYGKAIDSHMDLVESRQKNRRIPGSYIGTVNGERRWFARNEDAHKAFNQRVQSNLGQFAIDWWMESDRVVSNSLTPEELETSGVVLLVHDSVVLLLPDAKAEFLVRKVQGIGVALWEKRFPGVPGGVDAKQWNKDD